MGNYFAAIVENPGFLEEFDKRYDELAPMIFFADPNAKKEDSKETFDKLRKFYFGDGPIGKKSIPKFIDVSILIIC